MGGQRRSRAQAGEDRRHDLTIAFTDAVFGCSVDIDVDKMEQCVFLPNASCLFNAITQSEPDFSWRTRLSCCLRLLCPVHSMYVFENLSIVLLPDVIACAPGTGVGRATAAA